MKRTALLIVVLLSVITTIVSAQQNTKDTCPCPIVTKNYPVPQKEKDRNRSVPQSKGSISQSFNDNIIIESYGSSVDLSSVLLPEKRVPVISNLKSVTGSFNRNITIKQHPIPANQHDCDVHHRWYHHDDLDWLWFLLFLGLVVALFMLATRPSTPPVIVHVPPAPSSPAPIASVPPSKEELDAAMEKAKGSGGSTFRRRSDGGYEIRFADTKQEKPADSQKDQPGATGQ